MTDGEDNLGAFAFVMSIPWFLEQTGSWDSVLLLFGGLYLGAGFFWLLLAPEGDIFEQSLISNETDEWPEDT